MSTTQHITTIGQSLWLDNSSRSLIRDGNLEKLITGDGVSSLPSQVFERNLDTHFLQGGGLYTSCSAGNGSGLTFLLKRLDPSS